jgi:hypothetical protein
MSSASIGEHEFRRRRSTARFRPQALAGNLLIDVPNDLPSKSLQPGYVWKFNGAMKAKIFTCVTIAGCILCSVAFGQTQQIKGTLCSFDASKITLQSGPDTWDITRTDSTKIISGTLKVGTTITVEFKTTDRAKKRRRHDVYASTCTNTDTDTETVIGLIEAVQTKA